MQARYAAARATVLQYTLPVAITKNTFSTYGDSDEDSDCPLPSPKKTDATEMKIDKSLQAFIEAFILNLFIMDSSFKHQMKKDIVFVSCKMPHSLENKLLRC